MPKRCLACDIIKELEDFHQAKDKPDGRRNTCKECRRSNKRAVKPSKVRCFGCDKTKLFTEQYFRLNHDTPIVKLRRKCLECYKRDELNRHYLRTYHMSLSQIEAMREEQNNECAICYRKHKLVVDHNHTTGQVRQLLCHACNKGIGALQESVTVLQNAIHYLRHYHPND